MRNEECRTTSISSFSIQHSAFSIKTTMYNLRRFIIKHHFVILFILLEVISVLLLANSQRFHRDRMVNTTNDVVGKIYE